VGGLPRAPAARGRARLLPARLLPVPRARDGDQLEARRERRAGLLQGAAQHLRGCRGRARVHRPRAAPPRDRAPPRRRIPDVAGTRRATPPQRGARAHGGRGADRARDPGRLLRRGAQEVPLGDARHGGARGAEGGMRGAAVRLLKAAIELWMVVAAFVLAYLLRFDLAPDPEDWARLGPALVIAAAAKASVLWYFGLFGNWWWRYVGIPDLVRMAGAVTVATVGTTVGVLALVPGFPRSVLAIDWALSALLLFGVTAASRVLHEWGAS